MNQAIFDQSGSSADIQNLINMGLSFENEEEGQDNENDMLLMDLAMPQEDLTLFKDMPNFNPISTMQSKLKRKRKSRFRQVAFTVI